MKTGQHVSGTADPSNLHSRLLDRRRKSGLRDLAEGSKKRNGQSHHATEEIPAPVAKPLDWSQLSILITGGTGSFGQKFVEHMLAHHRPRRLIVFSRDELKQFDMRERFPDTGDSPMRYFIGDIRDKDRLYRAFRDVDVVVHAAALKQVATGEYNPMEVIKTNILGSANIIDAAIDCRVKRVVALSSDKAVYPVNLYGATKMCADKLFLRANVYTRPPSDSTLFAVVRYGNVIGSRGSVLPLFESRRESGSIPITDPRMTRFWITLDQAAAFVRRGLELMRGGEIFVPRLPSTRIVDLADAIAPGCRHEIIGVRPGEKIHEELLSEEEISRATVCDDFFVVRTQSPSNPEDPDAVKMPASRYCSENNNWFLDVDQLRDLVKQA